MKKLYMTSCDTSCGSESLFEPYLSVTAAEVCSQLGARCQKGQCGSHIANVNLTIRISDLSVVAVTVLQTCVSESSRQSQCCVFCWL